MRKKRPVIVNAAAQIWPRALSEDPPLFDFKPAGKYFRGRFALDDAWRKLRGLEREYLIPRPLRLLLVYLPTNGTPVRLRECRCQISLWITESKNH